MVFFARRATALGAQVSRRKVHRNWAAKPTFGAYSLRLGGKFLTQPAVNCLLVVWLCVTWGAALVRADSFPLTWAPMYSAWEPHDLTSNRVVENSVYMRGLLVTRRDGTTGYVGARELNISRNHMYRLYYQRAFGQPPVSYAHGDRSLSVFNRWIRGLEKGEESSRADTEFRLFRSLNKTLEQEPDDPGFIVRVQASFDVLYRRFDDLSKVSRGANQTDLRWDESWRDRW